MSVTSTALDAGARQERAMPGRVAMAVILVLGFVPLLMSTPAPLQDWPLHLARVHILDTLLRGSSTWDQYYTFSTFDVPNVALDIGVLAFMRLGLPDMLAGQVFLLLTYSVFIGGFLTLARRFGPIGVGRVAIATLLFTCSPLYWGLVNYTFATGVMMFILAAWLAASGRPARRYGIAVLGAALLFFCHLIVALAFAWMLACAELHAVFASGRGWLRRVPANLTGLAAVSVAGVLLRLAPHTPGHDFDYVHTRSLYAFVRWKIMIFLQLPLGGPLLGTFFLLGCALVIAVLLLRGRPVPLLPGRVWAILAGGVLLSWVTPSLMGGGALFDERLAYLPSVLFCAAITVAWHRRPALGVETALAVAAIGHAVILAVAWHAVGTTFAAYDRAVAALPPGSMMLKAMGRPYGMVRWTELWAYPYTGIDGRAVYGGVFVPSVFADPSQQPVALRPEYDDVRKALFIADAAAIRDAAKIVGRYCDSGRFKAVNLTITYPLEPFTDLQLFSAPNVSIIDGCRFAARYRG